MHCVVRILDNKSLSGDTSITQFKLITRLRKMVYSRLYRTSNLIIIYCCAYFGLLGTIGNVIWSSMELMKGIEFGF